MKSATPTAIGSAMTIARMPARTVPNARAATPKTAPPALSGSHSKVVRKLTVSTRRAGTAFATRKTAIAPVMTRTVTPDPDASHRRTRSPMRDDRACSVAGVTGDSSSVLVTWLFFLVASADLRDDGGRLRLDAGGERR